MKRWRVIPVAVLMLTCLALLSACQWKGDRNGLSERGNDIWNTAAQRLRVYPSTRISTQDGSTWLEARVEFLDGMDDPCKAVGTMHFELLAAGDMRERAAGEILYAWNAPLLTLNDQHAWDPVTRTYRFRLKLDDAALLQRDATLLIWHTPLNGDRMETRARLSNGVLVEE